MIPCSNALLFRYQSDKNTESILATSTRWSLARKRHLYTLRPFETLLFSGLPMMIWQKNLQRLFSFYSMVIQKKKLVKWQKFKTALCDLTKKLLLLNIVRVQFWTEISNQSGSQIHAWILLKKNSIISVFILVFAGQVLFTVNGLF